MAVLFVLILVVMGYVYTQYVPYEKALLKRSTGWETYIILAKHGLWFGLQALFLIIIYVPIILFVVAFLTTLFRPTIGLQALVNEWLYYFSLLRAFEIFGIKDILLFFLFLLATWLCCVRTIEKDRGQGLGQLKSYDSFLDIILTAMSKQIPVKISLKSRKVYVGTILKEQFEHVNFDNISIIPQLSGYRHKDTLKVKFDCNYSEIYQEKDIKELSENGDKKNMQSLSDFRLNIKVSEIESISFFYQEIYEEFKVQDKKNSILG